MYRQTVYLKWLNIPLFNVFRSSTHCTSWTRCDWIQWMAPRLRGLQWHIPEPHQPFCCRRAGETLGDILLCFGLSLGIYIRSCVATFTHFNIKWNVRTCSTASYVVTWPHVNNARIQDHLIYLDPFGAQLTDAIFLHHILPSNMWLFPAHLFPGEPFLHGETCFHLCEVPDTP